MIACVLKNAKFEKTEGVHASTAAQNRKVLEWLAEGKIDTDKYIAGRPLCNIMEAFRDLDEKGIMKAVIVSEGH